MHYDGDPGKKHRGVRRSDPAPHAQPGSGPAAPAGSGGPDGSGVRPAAEPGGAGDPEDADGAGTEARA